MKTARVRISKFGDLLISRPTGREAFLAFRSSLKKDGDPFPEVEIDFTGVKVLAPSWLDEFTQGLKSDGFTVVYRASKNASVIQTLKTLTQIDGENAPPPMENLSGWTALG